MSYKKYGDLDNTLNNTLKSQHNPQQHNPQQHNQQHNQRHNPQQHNQNVSPLKNIKDCESISSLEHKNKIIKEYKYVVVDVYGDWCGPCKKIYPKVLELQNKWPTVKFVKEDIDKKITNVNGVPYFQFYKEGKFQGDSIGASILNVNKKIEEMYTE